MAHFFRKISKKKKLETEEKTEKKSLKRKNGSHSYVWLVRTAKGPYPTGGMVMRGN